MITWIRTQAGYQFIHLGERLFFLDQYGIHNDAVATDIAKGMQTAFDKGAVMAHLSVDLTLLGTSDVRTLALQTAPFSPLPTA